MAQKIQGILLIFENLWAYALIQDYAFIRTLRVVYLLLSRTICSIAYGLWH